MPAVHWEALRASQLGSRFKVLPGCVWIEQPSGRAWSINMPCTVLESKVFPVGWTDIVLPDICFEQSSNLLMDMLEGSIGSVQFLNPRTSTWHEQTLFCQIFVMSNRATYSWTYQYALYSSWIQGLPCGMNRHCSARYFFRAIEQPTHGHARRINRLCTTLESRDFPMAWTDIVLPDICFEQLNSLLVDMLEGSICPVQFLNPKSSLRHEQTLLCWIESNQDGNYFKSFFKHSFT